MAILHLGSMTLRSMATKPETLLYPFETKPAPHYLKGSVINAAEDCILCGICEKKCPADAIVVSKEERNWSIDRFRCVQCGACIDACPKNCLSMDPAYCPLATQKTVDNIEVEKR